jgi:hypothetical protein
LSYDPAAAERVRQLLSGRSDVVEKKMVGGLSFLVNGNMCCGITGMALMVRVGAESREQALRQPHARPMLFAGRACPALYVSSPKAARLMMPSPEQGEGRETRPPSDMFSSGSGTRSALGRVPLTQPLAPPLVGGRASAVAYRVLVQAPVASRPHDPIFTSLSSS